MRGQSFQKWKDVNYTPVTEARPTIYLVPLGDFHVASGMQDAEFDFLEALRSYTSAFYLGMEVTLLPAVKIIHEIQEDEQEGSSPKPEESIDYQSLTCERLRELLRKRGCKTSGSKRQLVERLQEADEEESEDSESPKYRTYLEYQPSGGGSVKRGEAVCRKAHEYDLDDSLPDARQFYISSICDFLQTIKPKNARCIIGMGFFSPSLALTLTRVVYRCDYGRLVLLNRRLLYDGVSLFGASGLVFFWSISSR